MSGRSVVASVTALIALGGFVLGILNYVQAQNDRAVKFDALATTSVAWVMLPRANSTAPARAPAQFGIQLAADNPSLQGVIVRDATVALDGKPLGCLAGYVQPALLQSFAISSKTTQALQIMPFAVGARESKIVGLLFAADGTRDCPEPQLLADLMSGRTTLAAHRPELRLTLSPGGVRSYPISLAVTPKQDLVGPKPFLIGSDQQRLICKRLRWRIATERTGTQAFVQCIPPLR